MRNLRAQVFGFFFHRRTSTTIFVQEQVRGLSIARVFLVSFVLLKGWDCSCSVMCCMARCKVV